MPSMNDSIIYIDKSSPYRSAHLIHLCDKVHPHRIRAISLRSEVYPHGSSADGKGDGDALW